MAGSRDATGFEVPPQADSNAASARARFRIGVGMANEQLIGLFITLLTASCLAVTSHLIIRILSSEGASYVHLKKS